MILTVTLNAALDVTYRVPTLVPHGSHRIDDPQARAGGKGINVARVLQHAGEPVVATGLVGGATGDRICADLDAAGLPYRFTSIRAESRRTVAVVADDSGDATVFNECGPEVTDGEWQAFVTSYDALAAEADVVVCSGSLPAGLRSDAYAELVRRAAGVPVIVDCEGPALLAAAEAGAALLKPNLAEARVSTNFTDPADAGRALLDRGAGAVVVSLGPDGLLALTPSNAWRASCPERLLGNPTGAGDACVGALAAGLRRGDDWPTRLRAAVAWSAGAVAAPLAGEVDATTRARIANNVHIKGVPCL